MGCSLDRSLTYLGPAVVARLEGLEPPGPRLRRPPLYPPELQAQTDDSTLDFQCRAGLGQLDTPVDVPWRRTLLISSAERRDCGFAQAASSERPAEGEPAGPERPHGSHQPTSNQPGVARCEGALHAQVRFQDAPPRAGCRGEVARSVKQGQHQLQRRRTESRPLGQADQQSYDLGNPEGLRVR